MTFPEPTSSAAGSPASPSAAPAGVAVKTTNGGCGLTSTAPFAFYDPAGSSWRTSQGSLFEEWATYSATWPRAGMTRNGTASRRQPSVPLTAVTESGSWPTPTANLYECDPEVWRARREREREKHRNGNGFGLTLAMAVQERELQRQGLWPTPTVNGNNNRKGLSAKSGDGLATAVKRSLWRTPKASDAGHTGRVTPAKPGQTTSLDMRVNGQERTPGQLNPTWVEWLQGFPLGWTEV
jgi:hypothetical protein